MFGFGVANIEANESSVIVVFCVEMLSRGPLLDPVLIDVTYVSNTATGEYKELCGQQYPKNVLLTSHYSILF